MKLMSAAERVVIWKETQNYVETKLKDYKHVPSIKYNLDLVKEPIIKKYKKTHIMVVDSDCANAAKNLIDNKLNPLLLNMSADHVTGGSVGYGFGAQEENLFRRSTYYKTLLQSFYPLKDTDLVYSPKVLFFRDDENSGYKFSEKPFECACVACPALKDPYKNDEGSLKYEGDVEMMINKVRTLLFTAMKHGHDSLVLSAHGCGAWRCPPVDIATIYKHVLEEFNGCFKLVVFAILNSHYLSPGKNYKIFKEILDN